MASSNFASTAIALDLLGCSLVLKVKEGCFCNFFAFKR
jgi:hypothetical protein